MTRRLRPLKLTRVDAGTAAAASAARERGGARVGQYSNSKTDPGLRGTGRDRLERTRP